MRNTTLVRFDAPEDYAHYLGSTNSAYWDKNCFTSYNGLKHAQALRALVMGDDTNLKQAEKIVDQMGDERVFSIGLPERVPSVRGGFINVPAALMGNPRHMYAREEGEQQSDLAPLSVYVETTVSSGVSQSELVSRGVAVLAFALAMNNIRPVEIFTLSYGRTDRGHNSIIQTKIASAPLDLARAVYMLTDPSFARRLAFSAIYKAAGEVDNPAVGWPWDGFPTHPSFISKMRELVGMSEEDVLLSGGHIYDTLMLTNPVQWVKNMIVKHCNPEG